MPTRITTYLYVTKSGNLRLTKKPIAPSPSELRIQLQLTVPDEFFQRPYPVATIDIPKETVLDMTATTAAKISAPVVAAAIGLRADDVADGLLALIQQKERELERART